MSVRLWCLRHAESENVVTRTSGAQPHAELTPRGRDQAAEAGRRLRGAGISHVYASSAVRAATTAGIVAVVGHVASLTAGLAVLCGLGGRVWGAPLPHAEPFAVEWDGTAWRCGSWPAECLM
ncbi:histidine phosphatase family protein [Nonomuraea sp. NPDC049421]|uniref:histidine phosphatase family protein n=1 Tax=Nonomuraea sp. NPDC049421 TaxID=3155275 RepID=UPI00342FCC06